MDLQPGLRTPRKYSPESVLISPFGVGIGQPAGPGAFDELRPSHEAVISQSSDNRQTKLENRQINWVWCSETLYWRTVRLIDGIAGTAISSTVVTTMIKLTSGTVSRTMSVSRKVMTDARHSQEQARQGHPHR